jgi:flagellar basal-body rod protein FlgB
MFNHVNLIEKSMDVMLLRQDVISNNIANADTPDYDAKHIEFETMFRQAIEDESGFTMKTSSPRHINAVPNDPLAVSPVEVSETWHTMRMDGNNVDVEREMVLQAENTIRYHLAAQQVNSELGRLRLAITG